MPTINEVTTLDVKDSVAVITLNSPPVNALSANVREGLNNGVSEAIKVAPLTICQFILQMAS